MTFEEAKTRLAGLKRSTLADHCFGDAEVYWEADDGTLVAEGYYGSSGSEVSFFVGSKASFQGVEANELRKFGMVGKYTRNDAGRG